MRIGTLIHQIVLEPELVQDRYIVLPEDAPKRPTEKQLEAKQPREGTAAREAWDGHQHAAKWWYAFDKLHSNKETLANADWQLITGIRDSIMSHPIAGPLLASEGIAEQAMFFDAGHGIEGKCKPDYIVADGWVLDVKSCLNASPRSFRKQAYDLGYDIQAQYYLEGCHANRVATRGFRFIAVEKTKPYAPAVYEASPMLLTCGTERIQKALALLAKCRADNHWPGYPEEIMTLDPPAWLLDGGQEPDPIAEIELS
jgi:exodeoxyribonuclease VIII